MVQVALALSDGREVGELGRRHVRTCGEALHPGLGLAGPSPAFVDVSQRHPLDPDQSDRSAGGRAVVIGRRRVVVRLAQHLRPALALSRGVEHVADLRQRTRTKRGRLNLSRGHQRRVQLAHRRHPVAQAKRLAGPGPAAVHLVQVGTRPRVHARSLQPGRHRLQAFVDVAQAADRRNRTVDRDRVAHRDAVPCLFEVESPPSQTRLGNVAFGGRQPAGFALRRGPIRGFVVEHLEHACRCLRRTWRRGAHEHRAHGFAMLIVPQRARIIATRHLSSVPGRQGEQRNGQHEPRTDRPPDPQRPPLHRIQQCANVSESVAGPWLQAASQGSRNRERQSAKRIERGPIVLEHFEACQGRRFEQTRPREHLVRSEAEAVLVGLRCEGPGAVLFGGHVRGRADDDAVCRHRVRAPRTAAFGGKHGRRPRARLVVPVGPGETKVGHLGHALAGDEHVAGLEVAVHQPRIVSGSESFSRLSKHPHPSLVSGVGLQPCGERRRLEQLHDQEAIAIAHAVVVDLHDVRVMQRRHRPRFTSEPLRPAWAAALRGVTHLDRHIPTELGVARLVDHAHGARTQTVFDDVATDRAAGGPFPPRTDGGLVFRKSPGAGGRFVVRGTHALASIPQSSSTDHRQDRPQWDGHAGLSLRKGFHRQRCVREVGGALPLQNGGLPGSHSTWQ